MAQGLTIAPSMGASVGGIVPVMGNTALDEMRKAATPLPPPGPIVEGLAAYVQNCWQVSRDHKEQYVDERLLSAQRRRNGEYDPRVLQEIRDQGGSEVYMMITATKCRAASAWLRDTLLGSGSEKPWTLDPTPVADLPPDMYEALQIQAAQRIQQYMQATGMQPTMEQTKGLLLELRDEVMVAAQEEAQARVSRMEDKMEDQQVEGKYLDAMSAFIDDLCTFPFAILKGPVLRRRPTLRWQPQPDGNYTAISDEEIRLEWARVSPFDAFWAPHAEDPDDGYFIERHRMTRRDVNALLGVPGFSEERVRELLQQWDGGGLREWISVDSERAETEGKGHDAFWARNPDALIDILEFHGAVQGKMLIEWGMDEADVEDPDREYNVCLWKAGPMVIKAQLNYDPLGRKPYWKTSFEKVPGQWCGNSVPDLASDVQDMCNAAARSLANNMGIASGPQVAVNVERLPDGEDITQMHPWKIWQFVNDPNGSTAAPIQFFAPPTMANELMAVYEKFSQLADEYTGIPRYMQGDSNLGSAGRTASGISMMIGNASKIIKQVVSNVDIDVTSKTLEYQYYYNMKYLDDPDLKGDVKIKARGAISILQKESAQVRRNELLQLMIQAPIITEIVGMSGLAEVLRDVFKTADFRNIDKIVPTAQELARRQAIQMAQQQAAMQQQAQPSPMEQIEFQRDESGAVTGANVMGPGRQLQNGAAATDNFSAMRRT